MTKALAALCGTLILAVAGTSTAAGIRGEYLEARNADVYTGPCFSNAEVLIYGNQAVVAWKVTEGEHNGVKLDGLCVAAAIKGSTTFSQDVPADARSVVIVDQRADAAQRAALVDLARKLAGGRLSQVVDVKPATMTLTVEAHGTTEAHASGHHGMPQAPRASFWAPGLAEIVTRPLDEGDHFCGNEVVAYQPLSAGVSVLPAYTLGHIFRGQGLNARWDDANCRSSFVGHFAL